MSETTIKIKKERTEEQKQKHAEYMKKYRLERPEYREKEYKYLKDRYNEDPEFKRYMIDAFLKCYYKPEKHEEYKEKARLYQQKKREEKKQQTIIA